MWSQIPEPLLLQIFMNLSIEDMRSICSVCHKWNRIANDEFLWKNIFYNRFKDIDKSINRPNGSLGYREEAKRLIYHTPMIESETLTAHSNQVLHVSFAQNGLMFSSCSRDGFVKVWSTESLPTKVKYSSDMKFYSWNYTQYSQFNEADTLLLVSGVHFGAHTASGEIAVFNIEDDFQLQCRVLNKPYDIFGTWFTNDYLISGRLHFLGHLVSCSALWLNKACQESDSERKPIIQRMFKFYNKNASSIRTVMVANCFAEHNESQDCLSQSTAYLQLNNESTNSNNCDIFQRGNPVSFSSTNRRFKSLQTPPNYSHQIDYYGALSQNACTNESPIRYSSEYRTEQHIHKSRRHRKDDKFKASNNDTDSGGSDFEDPPLPWNEDWLKLSDDELSGDEENKDHLIKKHKLLEPRTPSSDEDSDIKSNRILYNGDKLLVFTAGSQTYTPHLIGIKRIKPFEFEEFVTETASLSQRLAERKLEQESQGVAASPNWLDEQAVSHLFDQIDHVIDLKGHIIGMCLSPDHRYLYVNSRSWPENATIDHALHPPPIAQQIDIHIIDLVTFKRVGKMLRSHKGYTPNDECFFIFLDCSEQFVASGSEDNHGYVWDRHYGNCLGKLPHNDIVNSVAFNPKDPEMLVTASDDYSLKIWRSKSKMSNLL